LGEETGEFRGDDLLRGKPSSIDVFKPFDLTGLETDKIAVNLFNLSLL